MEQSPHFFRKYKVLETHLIKNNQYHNRQDSNCDGHIRIPMVGESASQTIPNKGSAGMRKTIYLDRHRDTSTSD